MTKTKRGSRVEVTRPLVLHADAAKSEMSNPEGYRVVLSCSHNKSQTGPRVRTASRS